MDLLRSAAVWTGRRWLLFFAVALVGAVWVLGNMSWDLAGKPVEGTEALLAQLQGLLTTAEFALAAAVGLGVLYQAQQTGRTVRLMEHKEKQQRLRERRGAAQAFAGICIEAAGYAGMIAEVQRRGLKTWRRYLPEDEATRQFLFQAFPQLNTALAAASKGLEQLRFSEPDLDAEAGALFDAVMEIYNYSTSGNTEEIEPAAQRIRQLADDLRQASCDG